MLNILTENLFNAVSWSYHHLHVYDYSSSSYIWPKSLICQNKFVSVSSYNSNFWHRQTEADILSEENWVRGKTEGDCADNLSFQKYDWDGDDNVNDGDEDGSAHEDDGDDDEEDDYDDA